MADRVAEAELDFNEKQAALFIASLSVSFYTYNIIV